MMEPDETPLRRPGDAGNAPLQFGIASLLLITTLVAIVFGMAVVHPGLGIGAGVLAIVALVWTYKASVRCKSRGQRMTSAEKVKSFSVALFIECVTVLAVSAASVGGFFGGVVGALALEASLAPPPPQTATHSDVYVGLPRGAGEAILGGAIGGLASGISALYVMIRLWRRWHPSGPLRSKTMTFAVGGGFGSLAAAIAAAIPEFAHSTLVFGQREAGIAIGKTIGAAVFGIAVLYVMIRVWTRRRPSGPLARLVRSKTMTFALFAGLGSLATAIAAATPEYAHLARTLFEPILAAPTLAMWFLNAGIYGSALSLGIFLALAGSQNRSLRRPLFPLGPTARGAAGSVVVGLLSATVPQLLHYLVSPYLMSEVLLFSEMLARVLPWVLIGAGCGFCLSFVVPNMKARTGAIGGAIGGAVGVVGGILAAFGIWLAARFGIMFVVGVGGAWVSVLGAAIAGASIGLGTARAEATFRRAWLEVHFSPRKRVEVSLGGKAITLGGQARECTVVVPGAPPVALEYAIVEGEIRCRDLATGQSATVGDGDRRSIGQVSVIVRSAESSKA